jgi:hypothetical protein
MMNIDLKGRVKNTKLLPSRSLLPLFEAIINAIHAIEEEGTSGKIQVCIERQNSQALLDPESIVDEPITGFVVRDNGSGFTERNYAAFQTSDSTNKAAKGGKGIGRLLWLKAFEQAEVESRYKEDGGWWLRRFQFALTDSGVENHSRVKSKTQNRETIVRLTGFKSDFQDRCPRSAKTIARRIVEHCLEYFVMDTCPELRLHDANDLEVIDLKYLFKNEILRDSSETEKFAVKDKEFRVTHIRVAPGPEVSHELHFCAHKREVTCENVGGSIPNLSPSMYDLEGKPFVYAGYVSGDYLDEAVNPERTSFNIERREFGLTGDISWQDLSEAGVSRAASFLSPFTEPIKKAKEDRIEQYVRKQAPQYRPILKHKREALDRIPPNLVDEKLEIELYKIEQVYDAELKDKYSKILANPDSELQQHEEFQRNLETFLEEWNEAGIAKLARHVVHRKATLSFLESRLRTKEDGKYHLENAVHKIIFPLKATSDDVPADRMNLWILDEKLAYHHYLASDLEMRSMAGSGLQTESPNRPDLAIFNAPSAFVDGEPPFGSVVIVEFKRPARNDYSDDENPITQLYDYVREIKAGTKKDHHGRPISVPARTPFYGYVVCDITPKLRLQAENAQLTETPDSHGYFGYNSRIGIYVEIISFDKLVGDAKQRNKFLFNTLGLPGA